MDDTNPAHALAAELAPCLGFDWTARSDHNWGLLIRLDGLSLTVSMDGKRAVISAAMQTTVTGYRYYDTYRNPRPQITCARRRGPQAIAADIQRRLLPDVEESYSKECEYIRQSNARHRRQQQTRQILAQAGNGHVVANNTSLVTSGHSFGIRPLWRAEVSPTPEYGVKLEINYLDLETAAQILEIVAGSPASLHADA